MKNKKILSRILALCSVAILLFALSVPCFADTVESAPKVVKSISFDDFDLLNEWYAANGFSVFEVRYNGGVFTHIDFFEGSNLQLYGIHTWSASANFANLLEQSNIHYIIYFSDYSIQEEVVSLTVNDDGSSYSFFDNWLSMEDISKFVFYYYEDVNLTPETSDGNGWYAQIKNIIKDAVFGQEAVLNDSQEFTVNQIALWLTLIVVLCPFIVVGIILVRCFR